MGIADLSAHRSWMQSTDPKFQIPNAPDLWSRLEERITV
jgi:hypothetical protein